VSVSTRRMPSMPLTVIGIAIIGEGQLSGCARGGAQ
jgi:hypothetical protein